MTGSQLAFTRGCVPVGQQGAEEINTTYEKKVWEQYDLETSRTGSKKLKSKVGEFILSTPAVS